MPEQTYTREQRVAAMRAAGFPEDAIPVGVAVSLAESWSGVGINNTPVPAPGNLPEYSVGPWQLNLLAHPEVSEAQALDLNFSTQYAYNLWRAHGWQPWGAFTSGAYLKFLEADTKGNGGGSAVIDPGITNSTSTPTQDTTTTGVASTLTSFKFPELQLGPFKFDSSVLFKLAITVGALFLVFFAIVSVTSGEAEKVVTKS